MGRGGTALLRPAGPESQPGALSDRSAPRAQLVDEYLPKVKEWIERSNGKLRADVAHERLLALGSLR